MVVVFVDVIALEDLVVSWFVEIIGVVYVVVNVVVVDVVCVGAVVVAVVIASIVIFTAAIVVFVLMDVTPVLLALPFHPNTTR